MINTAMEMKLAKQTLAEIKEKIQELQKQAEELRAEEIAGVITRIREAIAHYELTVQDLFGTKAAGGRRGRKKKMAGKTPARKAGVIRFKDSAGNTWTGRGKRPNWFKAALASGMKPEDLAA